MDGRIVLGSAAMARLPNRIAGEKLLIDYANQHRTKTASIEVGAEEAGVMVGENGERLTTEVI
jgi:hypothetical protein